VAKTGEGGARRRGGRGRGQALGVGVGIGVFEIAIAFSSLATVARVSAVGDPEIAADALRVRRV